MTVRPRERIKHQKLIAISLNNKKQRCQFFCPFFSKKSVWMFSKLNSCLPFLLLLASKFQTVKKLAYCRCDAKKEKKRLCFHNTIMAFDVIPDCGRYVSEKIVTRGSLYNLNLIYNYTYIIYKNIDNKLLGLFSIAYATHNKPFHSYVLNCQSFNLEWGWKWPCCNKDQYLVSIITK